MPRGVVYFQSAMLSALLIYLLRLLSFEALLQVSIEWAPLNSISKYAQKYGQLKGPFNMDRFVWIPNYPGAELSGPTVHSVESATARQSFPFPDFISPKNRRYSLRNDNLHFYVQQRFFTFQR